MVDSLVHLRDHMKIEYKQITSFNVEMETATIEYSVGLIMDNNSASTGD